MTLWHHVQHAREINKLVISCLAIFQTNAIGNSCSKLSVPIHQIPCIFLTGKLIRYMLKYDRIHNLILLCMILDRNVTTLGICLHIFTNSFHPSQTAISEICSVRFFRLQKFVVCPLFITTICSVPFFLIKFCSVRFFRLQMFCSVRFLGLQMFCSVRFLGLQMFCSVRFLGLQMFVVCSFGILQCPCVHIPSKDVYPRLNVGMG